jgi:ankyrin repeat protein
MASGMTREDAKAFINEMLSLNQLSQETTKVYNVWFDAIKKGDLDSMQRIYTQYSMIDVNRSDPETKRPPLSTAALLANIPLIEFLCEMTTIDLSVQDINGRTPWHWIVIGNNLGILKLMLETVTSKRNTNWHEMLNTVDNENFTPLDYAMKYKYSEMAKLLENNGGVRGPISEAVYKNWFKAIRDRNLDGMQKIYEEYSHIDVNRSDPETNRPPLSTALHPENIPLIKFLCQIPTIDLSVQDDLGCTAWHLAAIKGDLETLESMRQVVSSGNKNWPEMLNIKNNKKLTPLDCVYALKFLCEKILSPLYRTQPHWFSADVIQIDYDRECQKHTETMQWLKENGGLTHRDWDTPAFN